MTIWLPNVSAKYGTDCRCKWEAKYLKRSARHHSYNFWRRRSPSSTQIRIYKVVALGWIDYVMAKPWNTAPSLLVVAKVVGIVRADKEEYISVRLRRDRKSFFDEVRNRPPICRHHFQHSILHWRLKHVCSGLLGRNGEKALRCGQAHNEAQLKGLFIPGLQTFARYSMRAYWLLIGKRLCKRCYGSLRPSVDSK